MLNGSQQQITSTITCFNLKKLLIAEKLKRYYQTKLFELVAKGVCPESPKPNHKKNHKDNIATSKRRSDAYESMITTKGC